MRIALLSDIHGNAVALEAVLADLQRQRIDIIAVLGDIAYRGPEPQRSIELVRQMDAVVIKGNADAWMVRGIKQGEVPEPIHDMMNRERDWAVGLLADDDLAYLDGLPEEAMLEVEGRRIHLFHATPDSMFEVVLPDIPTHELSRKMLAKQAASLYVCAHIHLPYVRFTEGKCLVNTGSVGLPFDGLPKASYAVAEMIGDKLSVRIERVAYDVERVVRQYLEGNYPNATVMERVVRQAISPFVG